MNRFTRPEQLMLSIALALLLAGWAVKAYRTAHSPATPVVAVSASAKQ